VNTQIDSQAIEQLKQVHPGATIQAYEREWP